LQLQRHLSEKRIWVANLFAILGKNLLKIRIFCRKFPVFFNEKIAPKKGGKKNLKVHQKSPQIKCQNKHEKREL